MSNQKTSLKVAFTVARLEALRKYAEGRDQTMTAVINYALDELIGYSITNAFAGSVTAAEARNSTAAVAHAANIIDFLKRNTAPRAKLHDVVGLTAAQVKRAWPEVLKDPAVKVGMPNYTLFYDAGNQFSNSRLPPGMVAVLGHASCINAAKAAQPDADGNVTLGATIKAAAARVVPPETGRPAPLSDEEAAELQRTNPEEYWKRLDALVDYENS